MAHMINESLSGFLYFNVEEIAVMVIINVDLMFPSDSVLELPHIGRLESFIMCGENTYQSLQKPSVRASF